MMRGLFLLAALGGCETYFGGGDDVEDRWAPDAGSGWSDIDGGGYEWSGLHCGYQPTPIEVMPPGACTQSLSLRIGTDMSEILPAVSLGTTPSTFCITLDTTLRTHPTYFDAQTPEEPGPRSKFAFAVYRPNGELVCAGYDAPLTTGDTYATVGIDIRDNAVFEIKLVAWARDAPGTTQISMGLYQVLD
jgi:hypothetical protein